MAHEDLLPDQNFSFRTEKNAKGVIELDARLRRQLPRGSRSAPPLTHLAHWWSGGDGVPTASTMLRCRGKMRRRKNEMTSGVHASVTGRGDETIYRYSGPLYVGRGSLYIGRRRKWYEWRRGELVMAYLRIDEL
jgi:hypothetical protein